VLTGTEIQQMGIKDVSDIAQLAPGIAVQNTGPGENTIVMRGVSSSAGVSSTTGVYYGEVPVSLVRQVDMPLFDLARVEVLRGPQGTLYGSGSMGGTIKYVPNVPEFNRFTTTVGVGMEHIDGSYGLGHKTYGVVNIPLVDDKLAARIMVFSQSDKGYIDRYDVSQTNPVTGVDTTIAPSRDVNSVNWYGYQIMLRYKPWNNVTITPMFLSQKEKAASLFVVDLPQSDLAAGQLLQARDANSPHSNDANIANLTIDATFSALDLVSTTSYLSLVSNENEDSAATQHVLMGIAGPVVAFPVWTWSKQSEV
jgi:outer membrane receptor protein involved in Fe transport